MGQSIFERIQAKIELFRLEQRYTRRRHRRSTFVSNAIYVDGEYIYNTPNSTGSSTSTSSTNASQATVSSQKQKKLNRFSSMPGFGSMASKNSPPTVTEADWRQNRNSLDGSRR
ncbi:uncharacterized protein MKZ38_002606 [Zalerion maritima]|uniref:Uncharacterized protein n=1 Tax=Zalerion maritima TaxID=339359 RepID=A0AAD5RPR0_9PEZI|nr:uncharacterized protein MKZ38_002606 [Zalerion maritima]